MNFNSRYYRKFLPSAFIFALFTFAGTAFGQSPEPAKPEMRIQKFESELMKREMLYQVFLPANYSKKKDASYPVVYFLHGYGGLMTYVQKNNQLVSYFARHDLIIVFPEGGNGFYTDSATVENDKYESYIIKELIPEVEKNFRTMADHENRVIAGASMGGYGALKFGLKYPEKFSLVGSLAGAIGVTLATEKTFGALGKTVDNIFGPLNSENRKANNLSAIVDKMTPEQVKALPMIYQSCGTEDFLIGDNRQFLALLNKKKIKHEYRELPGAHSDDFFTGQIREFLDVAERHLKK